MPRRHRSRRPASPASTVPGPVGLYHPSQEHDACGIGFVADIGGSRSHRTLSDALECLSNLAHRGATDADAKTGDGAGILSQLPHRLFDADLAARGQRIDRPGDLAVGMVFLPREDRLQRETCRLVVEEAILHLGLQLVGWREVPTDPSVLGGKALQTMPSIQQVLFARPAVMDMEEFESSLYLCRKMIEKSILRRAIPDFYIASFSNRTVVYKGLFVAPQLRDFYLDLKDPSFQTAFAVFHQRYSTNTFPQWRLAQPFRMLCHNGEINTLAGNVNWMRGREQRLAHQRWGRRAPQLLPVIQPGGSDSAALDNALELLSESGRDVLHSMTMLVPEAWEHHDELPRELCDYYKYHSFVMEPWDGPAALVFADGSTVGATLDRNGLRPARYVISDDNRIVMGSEAGILDIDPARIVEKGRLSPGRMLAVDTARGRLLRNGEIKGELAGRRPWGSWLASHHIAMPDQGEIKTPAPIYPIGGGNPDQLPLVVRQRMLGYNSEEVRRVLVGMFKEGKEAVGSMGDDTPLAVLSQRIKPLHHFFKQRFAQVTNPPIDSIREDRVMALGVNLGRRHSLLEETPSHARMMRIESPVLTPGQMRWLFGTAVESINLARIPIAFDPSAPGADGLERALADMVAQAIEAVDRGAEVLVLTDDAISRSMAPIPSLLAVAHLHHALIREGRREDASIIIESGEVRDTHSLALLLGYGASAVYPYLAFEQLYEMAMGTPDLLNGMHLQQVFDNFIGSMEEGLMKIMAKMGISTLSSYIGAQIFEAIGLDRSLVDVSFCGTPSAVGGIGMAEVAENYRDYHRQALQSEEDKVLPNEGLFTFSSKGEYHAFNPTMVKQLHRAVRERGAVAFREFSAMVNGRPATALRDLLDIESDREPLDLDDVEPVSAIVKRFSTAAMSYGSLSLETHETIAIAMNRIGGRSNSGEGGEDRRRYRARENGDLASSAVKQIASGRFGVTAEYCANAKVLEIKMAQGSKPGEGGQLPGHKVSTDIAAVRNSTPGVTLISPPPHHDIYSIEDLAQLIFDLKRVNPRAKVCVKLVAEAGVGTIAAGVAKAGADMIHISGHDGGTGASPLSSIKHAGSAWEIGLAEAQQVLVLNDLRGRVTLRVDGGLKSGRDIVLAALLGAEEYVFGTGALVALGCVMARQCHTNKCPVGIATQDPALRAKFPGAPDHLIAYLHFVAEEARMIMAEMGYDSLNDLVGRPDLLRQRERSDCYRSRSIDLSPVLAQVDPERRRKRRRLRERNERLRESFLDDNLIQDAKEVLTNRRGHISLAAEITNRDRTVGAGLAGEIAFAYGDEGLPDGEIEVLFRGSAGQSFGAFSVRGMTLRLIGEANDYVGKSMSGGKIAISPPEGAAYAPEENIIVGNTVLYGACGGALYVNGRAGERFAVRNSGAVAVVEGAGDHCCEYMTRGTVLVLGETGRNFGAGMTGGTAYVWDPEGAFPRRYNPSLVGIHRITEARDAELVRSLLEAHVDETNSPRARRIVDAFAEELPRFWKVLPYEVAKLEQEPRLAEAKGAGNVPVEPGNGGAPARG